MDYERVFDRYRITRQGDGSMEVREASDASRKVVLSIPTDVAKSLDGFFEWERAPRWSPYTLVGATFVVGLAIGIALMLALAPVSASIAQSGAPTPAAQPTAQRTAAAAAATQPTAKAATAAPAATTKAPTTAPAAAATEPATAAPATAEPTAAATEPPTAAPATAEPTVAPTAAASEAPTAAPSASYIEYTVQKGDILTKIAQRYNVTVDEILAINQIRNPQSLSVGQVIRIPKK
jgi:LysM repeat protein